MKTISLLLSSFLLVGCNGEKANVFVMRNTKGKAYVYQVEGMDKRTGEFKLIDGPVIDLSHPSLDGSVCAMPKSYNYMNFLWKRYWVQNAEK